MKVVIIGSGPGGLTAAIRAAELGAQVVIVEKDKLGGVCLNEGCIPTKKLLDFAKNFLKDKELQKNPKFNWQKAICEKENLIEYGKKHILGRFKLSQIKAVKGEASFINSNALELKKVDQKSPAFGEARSDERQTIEADKIIIATGSLGANLRIFDYGKPGILTPEEALNLKEIPKSLIIVGGGVIGLEFVTIFRALGAKITIIEMMETLLPGEDPKIVQEITQILKNQGIEILTQTKCQEVISYDSDVQKVRLSNGRELQAEKILAAVGRIPNTKKLTLKRVGVQTDQKGFILVNEKMETNVKGIYAVGDVACSELVERVGKFFLAPVASLEGEVAAKNASGFSSEMDYLTVPRCIFTFPQIGICGLNPEEAFQAGHQIKVGRAYFKDNAAAQIIGEVEGFLQIIVDKVSDKILGAQIIGPEASLLIQEVALAMKGSLPCQRLAETCPIHPTLAEIIQAAAKNAERRR